MRLSFLVAVSAAALAVAAASAQSLPDWAAPPAPAATTPPTGPGTGPGTPSTPTQSVPVDGGLGLLALAGGAYAARRLRHRR